MPEEAGFGCVVVYPSVTSSNVGVIYGRTSGAGHHLSIYRGCGPENKYSLTWTLDKNTAERKRFMMRS